MEGAGQRSGRDLGTVGVRSGPSEAEPHSAENASGFGTLFSFGRDMQGEINPMRRPAVKYILRELAKIAYQLLIRMPCKGRYNCG